MFSLPDFTPRDSYSLWYTSPRRPNPYQNAQHAAHAQADQDGNPYGDPQGAGANHQRRQGRQHPERTLLTRLRTDEANAERRRHNIQNFGSTWLRPPGIPKTLHQLREEKREQDEHQEALRREQLVQELAEAEAAGADGGDTGAGDMLVGPDGDEGMSDVQLDGARDLDDEIPDAEDGSFGLNSDEEEEEEEDEEEDDEEEDEEDEEDEEANRTRTEINEETRREERSHGLRQAHMQLQDDAFREAMARGDVDGDDMYGGDEDDVEDYDDVDRTNMLEEDDMLQTALDSPPPGSALGMGMENTTGMDMDLDDEIPDADADASGIYEHTDSEAELSSSERGTQHEDEEEEEEDDDDLDDGMFGMGIGSARRSTLAAPMSPTLRARNRRESALRESMDLSSLLRDESSFLEDSIHPGDRR